MNSIPDDMTVSGQIAEKMGLEFMPCTITEEGVEEREYEESEFDRYGELARKYGNNQAWFQIFRNKKLKAFSFGCFGETLRELYIISSADRDLMNFHMNLSQFARI